MKSALRVFSLLAFLLLLGHFATAAPATAEGELRVSVREVSATQSNAVQLVAKVVDQTGKPVAGLTPSSFTLNAGGHSIPITKVQSVADAQVGISSQVIIDTSGSMVGAPMTAARQAAAQYVGSLQPVDEVSVVSFSNNVQVVSDFSQDFASVQSDLANLNAYGDTALYDAVADASRRIAQRDSARRAVIFETDGRESGASTASRTEALTDAKQSGVPFYVIGLGSEIDAPFLQQLASSTGGAYFAAPSSAQLSAVYSEIASYLRGEYVVTADFSQSGLTGSTAVDFAARAQGGSGGVQVTIDLPALGAAVPEVPQPVDTAQPATSSGGGAGTVILVLLLGAIAVVAGWLVYRRIRKRREELFVFEQAPIAYAHPEEDEAAAAAAISSAPEATLRLGSGEEFHIHGVATLGVDPECTFQLPISRSDFGQGELRVWFANQRYMIHDVATRARIRVNGRPVTWSFLGDGDEIEVKGVTLHFSMAPAPVPSSD